MKCKFEMSDLSDLTKSIVEYQQMYSIITQLDPAQRETTQELHERLLQKTQDKKYLDPHGYQYWEDIDIHIVKQSWGSTACGWGGMGGSAMTDSYTVVITNVWYNVVFVFYRGKLAYVADWNDSMKKYESIGWQRMPAFYDTKELKIFYKNNNKR